MNPEKKIDNRTPMALRALPMDDRHGQDVLVLIAKHTWSVSKTGAVRIAYPGASIRIGPERTGFEGWASWLYPSDVADEKPGTDIVLVGHAYPPEGKTVTERDVTLRVETGHRSFAKTVRVFGPRVYQVGMLGNISPGPAGRLEKTPLIWELAYGGHDLSDPTDVRYEPRNPSGRGFARDRTKLVGKPAHQIEDPDDPSRPAGFAPIAAFWSPRADRVGTHDEAWAKRRAPVRPKDFDARHHCVASPDLWSEAPLLGDEAVEVVGATPEGVWRFKLPLFAPKFDCTVRGVETPLTTHLDTFLIDADNARVELTWRTAIPLPRKSEHLDHIRIHGEPPLTEQMWKQLDEDIRAYDAREEPRMEASR